MLDLFNALGALRGALSDWAEEPSQEAAEALLAALEPLKASRTATDYVRQRLPGEADLIFAPPDAMTVVRAATAQINVRRALLDLRSPGPDPIEQRKREAQRAARAAYLLAAKPSPYPGPDSLPMCIAEVLGHDVHDWQRICLLHQGGLPLVGITRDGLSADLHLCHVSQWADLWQKFRQDEKVTWASLRRANVLLGGWVAAAAWNNVRRSLEAGNRPSHWLRLIEVLSETEAARAACSGTPGGLT